MKDTKNFIKFLGTGGARYVVSRQLRSSAGTWLNLKGKNILIDPGPGTLVHCYASRPKLDPANLDAIILTHRHLDHSSDLNVLIEAMTGGRLKKRGVLFIPSDAVNCDEPVVFKYLLEAVERVEILREGGQYSLGEVSFFTPVIHKHSVETYGLKFEAGDLDLSLIVDTAFFPELIEHYKSKIIILNVVLFKHPGADNVEHLDLDNCKEIIRGIKPELALLTHFGLTMLKNKPWLLAEEISRETGVEVKAAGDGMMIKLDNYLKYKR